jgi:hypothetical protein
MSEDRHYFSDPRPIAGLDLPTWDVDVYREGVPEPILTLRIDPSNLPPRTGGGKGSKKKKVVWKLPDGLDQVPRFGVDEKRRLLDLFKNLKKERRKKNGEKELELEPENELDPHNNNPYNDDNGNGNHNHNHNVNESTAPIMKSLPPPPGIPSLYLPKKESPPPSDPLQQQQQQPQPQQPPPIPATTVRQPDMILQRRNSAPLPPGIHVNVNANGNGSAQPGITNGSFASLSLGTTVTKPPPGMLPRAQSLPLDEHMQTTHDQQQPQTQTQIPPATPISALPPLQQSEEIKRQSASQLPYNNYPPGQNNEHSLGQLPKQQPLAPAQPVQQPLAAELPRQPPMPPPPPPAVEPPIPLPSLIPPARYLTFPATTMPSEIFAQQVANLYISLLQSGQVDELLLHYTLTAQKSLSLKSAKAMCRAPQEIKTQLTSLVGCGFAVQGITVQEGFRNSLLIIWSGICQLQGQQHGFCQTLILVPLPALSSLTEETILLYQIQNDALVLLTND